VGGRGRPTRHADLAFLAQCLWRLRPSRRAQSLVKVLVFAFLLVGGTVGLLIVLLLYVLDLRNQGWTWHYVALLGAMLASTDAVAIVATMKSGAGRARAPLGTRSPRPAPDRELAARGWRGWSSLADRTGGGRC